jgi:proteasome lid subunit RPN8/RPN11
MKAIIPDDFIRVIKNQALNSENEIYGWLIGYKKKNVPRILAIFECKRFVQQSLISAIPHAKEFQEISSILPQGIGAIGIYHSHPFSSDVFHSHTDDATLLSLSRQFPKCVSIVTNGEEINFFQINDEKTTSEIQIEYNIPSIPQFILIEMDQHFQITFPKKFLTQKNTPHSLKIKLFNKIGDFFEDQWKKIELIYKGKKLSLKDSLKKYTVNNFHGEPIHLQLGSSEFHSISITPDTNSQSYSDNTDHYETYKLHLKAKIPIYIPEKRKNIKNIIPAIKTELISNNFMQKTYNLDIDESAKKFIVPEDIFLHFFGFFIKLMLFPGKSSYQIHFNESESYQILLKLVSLLETFHNVSLKPQIEKKIQNFLAQIRRLHENCRLNKELLTKIKNINKKLNFKNFE